MYKNNLFCEKVAGRGGAIVFSQFKITIGSHRLANKGGFKSGGSRREAPRPWGEQNKEQQTSSSSNPGLEGLFQTPFLRAAPTDGITNRRDPMVRCLSVSLGKVRSKGQKTKKAVGLRAERGGA